MPSERLLYQAKMQDPASGLPIYVFDTTFLPIRLIEAGSTDANIRNFTTELWEQIPSKVPFCLVFFTTVFSKFDLSSKDRLQLPLNMIKIFKVLPVEKREMLSKVYMVHGNWLVKSFMELFMPLLGTNRMIVHCKNLKQLSEHMDITAMPISMLTYVVDRAVYKNKAISPRLMRQMPVLYGTPLIAANGFAFRQFSRIYNNLMAYLKTPKLNFKLSKEEWQMVMRINYLDDETRLTVSIMNGCLKRNQCVYMSDFSFLEHYIILMKFVYKLSDSYDPILPLSAVVNTGCDWDNAEELNVVFNNLLVYQHQATNTAQDSDIPSQYDNSYILIKLFKFFHTLLEKLNNEVDVFDDYKKYPGNVKRRQILRLILAFTKVLYDDDPDLEDLDGSGFDALFKFVYAVMRHYSRVRVFGTSATLEEFNNYITVEDSIGFGRFKDRVLAALEQHDDQSTNSSETSEEKKEEDTERVAKVENVTKVEKVAKREKVSKTQKASKVEKVAKTEKAARTGKVVLEMEKDGNRRNVEDTTGKMEKVGKTDDFKNREGDAAKKNVSKKEEKLPKYEEAHNSEDDKEVMAERTEPPMSMGLSAENSISEVSLETSSKTSFDTNSESATTIFSETATEMELSLCGDFRSLLKTRVKPMEHPKKKKEERWKWRNELVKPSNRLTSRLIKYTEKDLIVQKERTKLGGSLTENKLLPVPIKGRKVSELAQLYEKRHFGESKKK